MLISALLLTGAPPAAAQVFLAEHAHPDFAIGPLIISATVPRDHETVRVNVSWSLSTPGGRKPSPQNLYLLWPREVAAATMPGPAEPDVIRYVEAQRLQVLASGRLTLRHRDRTKIGTGDSGEPLDTPASYVTFMRAGAPQLGIGTLVKIAWTPKLGDPLALITLGLPLKGMVAVKPASWFAELFWGRRWLVTSTFGDVGQIALSLFPIYFERRDHLVPVARDFALMTIGFPDAHQLRIEEITPATATRRASRVREGNETVSLLLPGGEGLSSQVLRVEFNYFAGRIAWRPILVSVALLAIGNIMGTIMLGQSIAQLARRWLWLGRGGAPPAKTNGTVIPAETLRTIEPGRSTHADVLRACGPPQEERERLAGHEHTLLYRGDVILTHRRFGFWWLAGVSHRELEHHEVVITLGDDYVRDVESRVSRTKIE
ncbi:MAG TPA: hypothetical protein VEA38_18620 [Terriglobales bacterium]|nr:hypothetical protein [Terriglobales bacterium]